MPQLTRLIERLVTRHHHPLTPKRIAQLLSVNGDKLTQTDVKAVINANPARFRMVGTRPPRVTLAGRLKPASLSRTELVTIAQKATAGTTGRSPARRVHIFRPQVAQTPSFVSLTSPMQGPAL